MTLRTKRAKILTVGAVAGVAAALTVGLSAPSGATPTASQGRGGNHVRLDRVFIIVLENHSAKSVIGDPNTPFITSLAQRYGEAANYFGVTHPSEPNYIAMTSGSNWFTTTTTRRTGTTTPTWSTRWRRATSAGTPTWRRCRDPLADFWPSAAQPLYASKHNPFALYTDIRGNPARVAHIKPYTALAGDLNSLTRPGSCTSRRTSATTCTAG